MSQLFRYTETPHVEDEAFRLLVLYDHKIPQTDWDELEAEIAASLAAVSGAVDGLAAALHEINQLVIRVQREFVRLGQ